MGLKKLKKIKYMDRKIYIVTQRIVFSLIKGFLFIVATISGMVVAFGFIAYAVFRLETQTICHFFDFSDWRKCVEWYQLAEYDTTGYIPSIVVAAMSMLLAIITLFQSHYNRKQDRALNFPDNCLNVVSIGLDQKSNLQTMREYFDPVVAQTMIEFSYEKSFSSYYLAYPYRLFICLDKKVCGKKREWEEIKIISHQNSNLIDKNPENYEIIIEGSYSRLLQEYCNKAEGNREYKLKMILDLRWTNNLLPWWNRKFADLYIREIIELNSVKEKIANKYKVFYNTHKYSGIWSARLELACLLSKQSVRFRHKAKVKEQKLLNEREKINHE